MDPTMDYHSLACSGAKTENLLPQHTGSGRAINAFGQPAVGQYGEVSQIDKGYLDENTTLVTFSIGGNDARFSDIIKSCLLFGAITEGTPCQDTFLSDEDEPMEQSVPDAITGPVRDSILQVLGEIHSLAPNAKIVLMGYPKLLSADGQCLLHFHIPFIDGDVGIAPEEATWLNDTAAFLNEELSLTANQASAQGIPTTFANPIANFLGKGVCGSPEQIHGIVLDATPGDKPQTLGLFPPSNQSFHPKIGGTILYSDALNTALRSIGM